MDSSSSLMIRVQETPELYFPVRHTSHVCLPWFAYTGKMPNDWASLAKIQKNWECFYSVRWPRFLLWQSEIMPSNNNDKTWTVGSRFCWVQLLLFAWIQSIPPHKTKLASLYGRLRDFPQQGKSLGKSRNTQSPWIFPA